MKKLILMLTTIYSFAANSTSFESHVENELGVDFDAERFERVLNNTMDDSIPQKIATIHFLKDKLSKVEDALEKPQEFKEDTAVIEADPQLYNVILSFGAMIAHTNSLLNYGMGLSKNVKIVIDSKKKAAATSSPILKYMYQNYQMNSQKKSIKQMQGYSKKGMKFLGIGLILTSLDYIFSLETDQDILQIEVSQKELEHMKSELNSMKSVLSDYEDLLNNELEDIF